MRTRLPRRLGLLVTGSVVVAVLAPAAQASVGPAPQASVAPAPQASVAGEDVEKAKQEVARLGTEVEAASAEYTAAQARLVAQENRVEAAEARVASQAVLVQMLEEQVVELAVETYKSGGVDPQLSLLATGRTERLDSTRLLSVVATRRAVTLDDVRDAEGELQRLRDAAQGELEGVQALEAELAQRRADIEASLAGAQGVLAVAEAEAQRLLVLEEARKAAEASRSAGTASAVALPPVGSGLLATPTPGRQAAYGWRIHPVYGVRKFHSGMDIITGCGTPVIAAADGVVESAGWQGSYGNIVVLRHGASDGGELSTAYAHLDEFAVESGPVSQGQVIGYVGTTGLSTGCHLHFEVRIDGEDVDPARFI